MHDKQAKGRKAAWLLVLAGVVLAALAERALARGELEAGTDAARLAWELHAFGLGLNWDRQLNGSAGAGERARSSARDRLLAATTKKGRKKLAEAAAA